MLDLLDDPAQRAEVERYAAEYPEIRAELFGIEIALEAYAEANAKPLNKALLGTLLADINNPDTPSANTGQPVAKATNDIKGSPTPPPAKPTTATGSTNWLPWVLAALAGALALYFFLTKQSKTAEMQEWTDELQDEFNTLRDDCDATETALVAAEQRLRALTNPATRSIPLGGTDNAPESSAIVFYNQELDRTIFQAGNLPAPPAGKQYQLWALDAEGTPIDLGVLALDLEADTLLDVDFIENASAFAITLEDEGGKPAPDLTQLQVIGTT